MQRCTSSDTLHSGARLLFPPSFSLPRPLSHRSTLFSPSPFIPFQPPFPRPTLQFQRVAERAHPGSPLLVITSDFILDAEIVVVYGHGFPKNSNIKSSAASPAQPSPRRERKKGEARERTRSWRGRKYFRIVSPSNSITPFFSYPFVEIILSSSRMIRVEVSKLIIWFIILK